MVDTNYQEIKYKRFAILPATITVDSKTIKQGSTVVNKDEITDIRFGKTNKVTGGRVVMSSYLLALRDKQGKTISIKFGSDTLLYPMKRTEEVWSKLMNMLNPIYAQVINAKAAEFRANQSITFGNATIRPDGVEVKGQKYPWTQIQAGTANGKSYLMVDGKNILTMYLQNDWNGVILMDLLQHLGLVRTN